MGYIEGTDRGQVRMGCLEEQVARDHVVRLIDRFVDILDLGGLGFAKAVPRAVGRPAYDPACLLKLYLFGYVSGTRSSRALERLSRESLPAMWLTRGLSPDFKTIADFRKDNLKAVEGAFFEYNSFLESAGMFGKSVAAIDGTKIKASNSKKRNFSRKKLVARIEYSKKRALDYLAALDEADGSGGDAAEEGLARALASIDKYEGYLATLDASGCGEVSETDPDARAMSNGNNGVDVAYNVQASVDAASHLVAAFDVSQNPTDHGQLAGMAALTQEALHKEGMTVLADKGYYNAEQLAACEEAGVEAVVARQAAPGGKGRERPFRLERFAYDPAADAYTCPAGAILATGNAKSTKQRVFSNPKACAGCPDKGRCLPGKARYRKVVRGPNADVLDRADKRFSDNAVLYRLRQQVVEHVFGTVKRTMAGGFFLLRTMGKVRCEAALLFTGYNIKRSLGVAGFDGLMARLELYAATLPSTGRTRALLPNFYSRCPAPRWPLSCLP
ncbi:MAG: IS1182 family transposase [Eggerthellaceae bacterium]|nr:IS1182 family transposase [Eggerthellaceae bacterium]